MQISNEQTVVTKPHQPWNKGKFTGPKPPLQAKHVWAIRTRLQLAERKRDLAPVNLPLFTFNHSTRNFDYIVVVIFSRFSIRIVAIATLTGAGKLVCEHALSSKVYASVVCESIEARCRGWVKLTPTANPTELPLWSESRRVPPQH